MGYPTWRYRKGEARIFDSDEIPEGWFDSPASIPADEPKKQKKKNRAS